MQEANRLQAGALLGPLAGSPVGVPVLAGRGPGVTCNGKVGDGVGRLEELDTQTLGNVPCDVAVHQPRARVIGRESKSQPSERWESGGVTTGGVGEGQVLSERVVPCTEALTEDVEVVTVEMDWVRRWGTLTSLDVLDDPVDPFTLKGELDQVLSDRELVVAVHDILDDRLAPVDIHGRGVQGPDDDVAGGPDGVERSRDELKTDGESLNLGEEVGDVANVVGDPWGKRRRSKAVTTVGVAGRGGRLGDLDTRVGEDGET